MEICGDNRFEIIAEAKKDLLEGTNIDTSPDEMKVLDNFLFRCWQMGWLKQYDKKDCDGCSYKPLKHIAYRCTVCIRSGQIADLWETSEKTEPNCDNCANKGDHDGECRCCVSALLGNGRYNTPSHYKPKTDCPWK